MMIWWIPTESLMFLQGAGSSKIHWSMNGERIYRSNIYIHYGTLFLYLVNDFLSKMLLLTLISVHQR